ncbi:MAG TPA: nucleotide disphospho-sugar-binding domain-containing protein [Kiloniellaceae bacterium]|nr:nucleotide disphospho-sugar-binding domain-containing protein [Kiloniellaceae bacterium]
MTEPFRTAGRLVCTLPELDPYAPLRRDPVIGPVEGLKAPLPRHEGQARFFAYVSLEHKKTRPFLQGLRASAMEGEVFARSMTDEVAKALARPGLTVHRAPQPMDEVLARCSLIVHHGGNGTCCAALSAGRPQLLLPTHMEARLSANALVARGCGRLLATAETTAEGVPPVLQAMAADAAMAARASSLAGEIAARGPQDTVERILATCLAVLGGKAAAR